MFSCAQCLGNGLDILLDGSNDYQLTGYTGIVGNPYCGQYQSGWWRGCMPSHIGGRFGAVETICILVVTPG